MNFFGHAAVASWKSTEPPFVLGAMLPDFSGMLRLRPASTSHPRIAAGMDLHHRTDELFHDHPAFRTLVAHSVDDLTARGLARGPARAAAHVGVEILIDGTLAEDETARRAYLAALDDAPSFIDVVHFDGDDGARLQRLCRELRARDVTPEHSSPAIVALRVERALSARPRLRLAAGDERRVAEWAASSRQPARSAALHIVDALRAGLT